MLLLHHGWFGPVLKRRGKLIDMLPSSALAALMQLEVSGIFFTLLTFSVCLLFFFVFFFLFFLFFFLSFHFSSARNVHLCLP